MTPEEQLAEEMRQLRIATQAAARTQKLVALLNFGLFAFAAWQIWKPREESDVVLVAVGSEQ